MTGGMMFKGTPGPWVKHPVKAQIDSSSMSTKGGLLPIAQCLWPTDERSEEETVANEHLIAAAPDLLESLQKIVEDLEMRAKNGIVDCSQSVYYGAHTAIAKALGEQK